MDGNYCCPSCRGGDGGFSVLGDAAASAKPGGDAFNDSPPPGAPKALCLVPRLPADDLCWHCRRIAGWIGLRAGKGLAAFVRALPNGELSHRLFHTRPSHPLSAHPPIDPQVTSPLPGVAGCDTFIGPLEVSGRGVEPPMQRAAFSSCMGAGPIRL